jgi:hypothetical protein
MRWVGFEPTIPLLEWEKIFHVSDLVTNAFAFKNYYLKKVFDVLQKGKKKKKK